jgi:osmotically-inducible protein OsmY
VTNRVSKDCLPAALGFHRNVDSGHIAASAHGYRRSNPGLRAAVLKALILDKLVPGTVVARVHDGLVTLIGTAERQYQRQKAELVCASVPGVIAVKNEIALVTRGARARGAHLRGAD